MNRLFSVKAFLITGMCFLLALSFFILKKKNPDSIFVGDLLDSKENIGEASDNPIARAQYEFEMLKDPATGKIPAGIRAQELAEAAKMPLKEGDAFRPTLANTYTFAGPSNLGGRIRSIVYDVRYNGSSNQTVFAGGVSGGVFKSTDGGVNWTRVSPTTQLYSVTCIAQDPRSGSENTWYYGTGESSGNSASQTGAFYFGYGVYKSTDNGVTWAKISNTPFSEGVLESFDSPFDIITSIAVNPINGDVYAGTLNTVMRLPGGSGSWVQELGTFSGTSEGMVDVKIGSNGIVYAGIGGVGFGAPASATTIANEGVWKRSLAGTWTRIGGQGTPAWFNSSVSGSNSTLGRIVLALDPNNEKNLYALYDNTLVSSCSGSAVAEAEFGKYDTLAQTWVDLSAGLPNETGCLDGNDPFAVQGGYDLILGVKPGDANTIFLGGTNIYRLTSSNTFSDATYTIKRAGGYTSASSYGLYTNSHPDIHTFAFQPGTPNTLLCGNDGGIQRTTDNTATTVAWTDVSNGLATYQFYSVAIDPTTGSTKYIGGAQDNGTTYRNAGTNVFAKSLSGDGVSVGISTGNTMHFAGSQLGTIYRKDPSLGNNSISADLTPSSGISSNTLFITLFHLDPDNTNNLYYVDYNELWRSTNATSANNFASGFSELTGIRTTIGAVKIRSIATSRGAYNASTSKLFFGTGDGRVFRVDDPKNVSAATAPVQINSGSSMPSGTIMGLAVNPNSSDTLLAVYSNYNVVSIWVCLNATSGSPTWTNIEGNLSSPSIRSAAIVFTNAAEYYVGTSTGLYSTKTLNGGSTVWTKEGSSTIGNAVVTSMALRTSDNTLVIGTHGNGMFSSAVTALPVKLKSFNGKAQAKNNYLYWSVEEEVNSKGYEIERKEPGELKFTTIGFVASTSDKNFHKDYNYTDNSVDLGKQVLYYRLKQIDLDGRVSNSPVITITRRVSSQLVQFISASANHLSIRFNGGDNRQRVALYLYDLSGRLLKQRRISFQNQQIIIDDLPRGTFILKLEHPDGRSYVQQFMH